MPSPVGHGVQFTAASSQFLKRVHDRGVKGVQGFGREVASHSHRVQFGANPGVLDSHLLEWVRPDDGVTVYLKVLGVKRPQSSTMPYVAFCKLFESGEGR